VLVKVGAVPPAHFTAAGHAIVLAVPSAVNASVIPYAAPDDAGRFENVMLVIVALRDTSKTVQEEQFKAKTPADIAGEVLNSLVAVAQDKTPLALVDKT
jgi:hypothetical protein